MSTTADAVNKCILDRKCHLDVPITTDILLEILKNSERRLFKDRDWFTSQLDYHELNKDHIALGGGVLVASHAKTNTTDSIIEKIDQYTPLYYGIYKADSATSSTPLLEDHINNVIKQKYPKKYREEKGNNNNHPIKIELPADLSGVSAILFSYLIFDMPWLERYHAAPIIINNYRLLNNNRAPMVSMIDERPGFNMVNVECGVGIFKNIQVVRVKIGRINNCQQQQQPINKLSKKKQDFWNVGPESSNYCKLDKNNAYLHLFYYVALKGENDIQITSWDNDSSVFSLQNNNRLIYINNYNEALLAPPVRDNVLTEEGISDLYDAVFGFNNLVDESMTFELPEKMVNLTMPAVDVESFATLSRGNYNNNNKQLAEYLEKDLPVLLEPGHRLGEVHLRAKLKIDERGVSMAAREDNRCHKHCNDNYIICINQPFCFALTVGDIVLGKGLYI